MKKYIAEFVGTFMLTFIACGIAVLTTSSLIPTALAFGLTVIAMSYTIGNVSGCHINPAVSLAMLLTKKMKPKDCICYIVAQILGAIAGSAILGVVLDGFQFLGANDYGNNVWIALLIEIILTFVFVTVVLTVTSKKENSKISGFVIGLTLTLVHLMGISFTGTSVNPARSIGPALFQRGKALSQLWLFILAPIIGAILASLFYQYVLEEKK